MSGGIEKVSLAHNAAPAAPEPNGTSCDRSAAVRYNGQALVHCPSMSSLIEEARQDSQEESTQLLQEKLSTKLSRREARTKAAGRIRELIQKYLRAVSSTEQTERFDKLLESLKKLGNPAPEQIRQQLAELRQGSEGDTFESGVLLALEELLSAEGGQEDLLAAVREAKTELGADLRRFYQDQVKTYDDVDGVYRAILGEHDEQDFMKATEMMISRLGSELQATKSAADANLIKAMVDSLYHLEVARNTYMAFAGLVEKMELLFGVVGLGHTA